MGSIEGHRMKAMPNAPASSRPMSWLRPSGRGAGGRSHDARGRFHGAGSWGGRAGGGPAGPIGAADGAGTGIGAAATGGLTENGTGASATDMDGTLGFPAPRGTD